MYHLGVKIILFPDLYYCVNFKFEKVKYVFIFVCLLFAELSIGQLKGAIPQTDVPENLKIEKKATPTTPTAIAKNNAEKLSQSLKLNQKQSEEIYQAFLNYETNVDKTNKSKLTNKEKYVKINKLNSMRQTNLKKILTKEQYNTYIMSFP